jgi:hypothetical protein
MLLFVLVEESGRVNKDKDRAIKLDCFLTLRRCWPANT